MAIYLDDQTRPVYTRILKKWIIEHPKDFVAERLWKGLESDNKRLEEISHCEHIKGEYTGEQSCCSKCGSFFDPCMGQHWTLKKSYQLSRDVYGPAQPTVANENG